MIRSLGGNRYSLKVPRTALFNVWVEPIVEVEVNLQLPPARRSVVIKVRPLLRWSRTIGAMVLRLHDGLNGQYKFHTVINIRYPINGYS